MPDKLPFYGTKQFKETSLKMFFRKSFLEGHTYDQVAIVIAHELSHVVLDSIRHPLHREEKAVDLTAMLLGFRHLYLSGAHKEHRTRNRVQTETVGYLSVAEVELANRLIDVSHADSRIARRVSSGFEYLTAIPSRISLNGAFAIIWVVIAIGVWFGSGKTGNLTQAPAPNSPLRTQLAPTERQSPVTMKATRPKDSLDNFMIDSVIKGGSH